MLYWEDFKAHGDLSPESEKHTDVGAISLTREIAPGAIADFTFFLAWHFPNRTPAWCDWESGSGREHEIIGNWYATRFSDAWAVADYLAGHLEALERESSKFSSAMKESHPSAGRSGRCRVEPDDADQPDLLPHGRRRVPRL